MDRGLILKTLFLGVVDDAPCLLKLPVYPRVKRLSINSSAERPLAEQ